MFKGRRDDHITIRVPQENCFKYVARTGDKWIEIRLPGGDDDTWKSFMVKPQQVCYDHNDSHAFNIIEELNRDTKIVVSQKIATNDKLGQAIVADTDITYDPLELLNIFADCNTDNIDYQAAYDFVNAVPSIMADESADVEA